MTATEQAPATRTDAAHHESPATIYATRQERFTRERDALDKRWNRVANLRLLAFLVAAACGVWAVRAGSPPLTGLALFLFIGYLVLVRHHAQLGAARRRAEERRAINEEATWRLERAWSRLPLRSIFRVEPQHPYAGDLDIFGPASLFHLLYPGGTIRGETTLRDWLLGFAAPTVVRKRQAAVAELAPRIELRDDLQGAGRLAEGPSPNPEPFLRWAEGEPWLTQRPAIVWAARLSPLLFWATLILWLTGVVTFPLWFCFFVGNLLLGFGLNGQLSPRLVRLMEQEGAFQHYAGSFAVLDGVAFATPLLARLGGELGAKGVSAYGQMRRLERLCRLIIPPSALSNAIMQIFFLWNVHVLVALESWQRVAGRQARRWLAILGEIEALAALAGLAHAQPTWIFPEIDPAARSFEATALGHPLLDDRGRVANGVQVGPPGSFLLVTGSNMSGKSTLLRAIGANGVLAGAGGPVCADALRLPPVALWTSMRIQDSLAQGVSYYMAELRRLKAVVDGARAAGSADGTLPLYLLDEILQGTNTTERQIAARRIIAHLVRQGAIGAVSTHDLNLADAAELATTARPIHFTEQFTSGPEGPTMTFDYLARPGIATSTNALRLMEIVGLDLADDDER
ncbi:MAG: MutS-related protein, family 1 [uncultured Thermomicrobiales bacterium]|uniref:MutS-related protein, family 1 n=1 Tax=uncultured Thermomicrobiales bacterium TaxID=1645740 RepID=A0A6J4VG32_9BACT|nr:MAG: MutS-related protein, family 1 [uncultured Thermomicrobiales bacterium]